MSAAYMLFLPQKEGHLGINEQDCEGSFDMPTVRPQSPDTGSLTGLDVSLEILFR